MTHATMSKEEEDEREEALAEVVNPKFLREDADAEGDAEIDDGAAGTGIGVNGGEMDVDVQG